ncbi:MAG: RraA family protein [Lachnospiraceae bacterium]|nr:RraA family protein [Lachnospiraceae bacterium]
MNNYSEKIIDYLIRNRVSTTEVADALNKTGVLPELTPVNRGHYKVGKVKWIYAYEKSNWSVHEQIQNIEEDCIILVDTFNCGDRAVFGELVSKYLILYRRSRALIVQGKMRDAAGLIRENWPIWCKGFTPVGCFNQQPEYEFDLTIRNQYFEKYENSIAVCDDCGVVIIPKEKNTKDFLDILQHIEKQEDIWFDRLDHYKENTFEIVCEKKYLNDDAYMNGRNL